MIFQKEGNANTKKTVDIAVKTALERNIETIVIASSTGDTAKLLKDALEKGVKVVSVTHAYGYKKPGENEMTDEVRFELLEAGISVITAAHVLSGAERGISTKLGGVYPVEIIAHTLRMFGQGVKVCVECATMAADRGAIMPGEPVIAIGGTADGADTAVILRPANANDIFSTKICEILCKPSLMK